MKLNEKIKNLPMSSGVYLMKDSIDTIIYVGKSKNLKSRVSSYFQKSKTHSSKVLKLVKNISDFDYITTDTEFEALILECKLIRELKPTYNKLMKNPKSYCYISLKLCEDYPYIKLTLTYVKDKDGLYFGPFNSKHKVNKAIKGIKEYFKILCTGCSNSSSACLNYSLGFCMGVCSDKISREEYLSIYNKIVNLFNGIDQSVIVDLDDKMKNSSSKLDFEEAIKYRDYISAIDYIVNKNKVIEYTKKNKSIAILEHLNDNEFKFFLIKGNSILCNKNYQISDYNMIELKVILKDLIISVFKEVHSNSIDIEREDIDKSQIIYTYLQKKSDNLRYIIVLDKWLKDLNNKVFDRKIIELLDFNFKEQL